MQKGQKEYAQRKALELFDAWNDVTGCFPKFTSYYYEICAVINDAVEIGSMVALGVEFEIKDGNLTKRALDFAFCAPEYHDLLDEAGDRFCRMCGQRLSQ